MFLQFGEVSGYKINAAKSALAGLNITSWVKKLIQKVFIVAPCKVVVKYLGVKITPTLEAKTLTNLNLSTIIKEAWRQL